MPDTKDLFDFTEYDYIVDAIDTNGKYEFRRIKAQVISLCVIVPELKIS